jgi:hypothetical protein
VGIVAMAEIVEEDAALEEEPEMTEEEAKEQMEYQNREAARQLSIILIKRGVNCTILTSEGFSIPSVLRLGMSNKSLSIFWRSKPEKLGCELSFVESVQCGVVLGRTFRNLDPNRCIGLIFRNYSLQLETVDTETCAALYLCLQTLLTEVKAADTIDSTNFLYRLRHANFQIAIQQEKIYQHHRHTSIKECSFILTSAVEKCYIHQLRLALDKWIANVRLLNEENKLRDKHRWRLHAVANMDIDLQAWYHSIFYEQVYRVRGPFWYREAALAVYRRSYDLVHNTLTALEENALAHVLCSTETTYGDVAGQMFTVQEIVDPDQYQLFQKLAASGVTVTKYPRMGRPAKKVFRLSFVEGYIYLTWKGRFGNQGVELRCVSALKSGICTEVTRKQGKTDKAAQYLSVISVGRSLDLFFETVEERVKWQQLLEVLVEKELGKKQELKVEDPPDATEFERLVTYASIGKLPERYYQKQAWQMSLDSTGGNR